MTALHNGIILLVLTLLAIGCARSPVLDADVEVADIGPAQVLEGHGTPGQRVVWGGRIVAIESLADRTELTIASYPLDRGHRPRINREAGVRFILVESGFLEPIDYAPGRFVTVLGSLGETEERATGEYLHFHPVLYAERIHLWPADPEEWQPQRRINLGVGVGVRL